MQFLGFIYCNTDSVSSDTDFAFIPIAARNHRMKRLSEKIN